MDDEQYGCAIPSHLESRKVMLSSPWVRVMTCAAVLSVVLGAANTTACLHYRGRCEADWMGELPLSVRSLPLWDVILPASHDSAAHTLNFSATPSIRGPGKEVFQVLLDLARDQRTSALVAGPIEALTVTQPLSIAAQLEQGVRALDFRVLYNRTSGSFFFSHTYAAVDMRSGLDALAAFLRRHPTEVLVVQLSADYQHRPQVLPLLDHVLGNVTEALGEWLMPFNASADFAAEGMSLERLASNDRRVLFVCGESFNATAPYGPWVWPSGTVTSFWPNAQTVNASMSRIVEYLNGTSQHDAGALGTPHDATALARGYPPNRRLAIPVNNTNQLNLVFFTLTPDVQSIVADVLEHLGNLTNMTSLRDYADWMRPPTEAALETFVGRMNRPLHLVSVDWPTDDLVGLVIGLNLRARK